MTFDDIPKLCITLPEQPERRIAATRHFQESGMDMSMVDFIPGISGKGFGLKTIHPFTLDDERDRPKEQWRTFFCGEHETGIFLSHYMAWIRAMAFNCNEFPYVAILEDDCQLLPNWQERVNKALVDCPVFDWMFCGSCGVGENHGALIAGEVYDCRYPCCFHFYIVSHNGLKILTETQRKIWAPIDVAVYHADPLGGSQTAFDKMRVVTILPRVAEQFNTVITP